MWCAGDIECEVTKNCKYFRIKFPSKEEDKKNWKNENNEIDVNICVYRNKDYNLINSLAECVGIQMRCFD